MQHLASRAAHELKNPLNGALLNVEVLRGRATRAGLAAVALAPFADAAATELARATELTEALLALARPVAEPVDLSVALQPLFVLAGAVARAEGSSVELALAPSALGRCALAANAVRGTVALALAGAVRDGAVVIASLAEQGDELALRLNGAAALPAGMGTRIHEAGVRFDEVPRRVTLLFPRAAAG
ncbi:MAG: histidine kinase dimerization/phospho-acceptor domain-containing protein [Gemmatimonadaceae bacterium]